MNFKQLIEKRNEIVDSVNSMFVACETEKRSFTEEEIANYEKLTKEIKDIDATLKMHEEARSFAKLETGVETKAEQNTFEVESRAFAAYLRSGELAMETRANMTMGDNGAVVPTTIANKIIETVENICPIYQLASRFNVAGSLTFPAYDETNEKVECAYATEFTALTSKSGKFTAINLEGYLAGALTKVSRSLINNAQFDIVSYVVAKVSQAIARFLEAELLKGSGTNAISGVMTTGTNVYTAASAAALTADDLVAAQMKVHAQYQGPACWLMNEATLLELRKLKDADEQFMLNPDIRQGFGYTLLGKPVHVSDQIDTIASGAAVIAYGDFSGLYVNMRSGIEIQILKERFADEHATGVVAWFEADAKVVEPQKIVVVKMA